jgi:hypothetical protein
VDERWLRVFEFLRNVTRKPEVRVLIDRAGDEAWDIGDFAENVREGVREGRSGLDGTEMNFADVVPAKESMAGILDGCVMIRTSH